MKRSCKVNTEERRRDEADVPLVGCLANDTENLFTGGIEKSSEEIRKVTGVTGKAGPPACLLYLSETGAA